MQECVNRERVRLLGEKSMIRIFSFYIISSEDWNFLTVKMFHVQSWGIQKNSLLKWCFVLSTAAAYWPHEGLRLLPGGHHLKKKEQRSKTADDHKLTNVFAVIDSSACLMLFVSP